MDEEFRQLFVINQIPSGEPSKSISQKEVLLRLNGRGAISLDRKLLIYDSKEGGDENLNGAATDQDGEPILCRHLAGYLAYVSPRGVKKYHGLFSTKETIAKVPYLKTNQFDKRCIESKPCYLSHFDINSLGIELHHIASHLNVGEEVSLILDSYTHAMAITLMHKSQGYGHSHYVIKLHDSNLTAKHTRVISADLKTLKYIPVCALFDDALKREYFQDNYAAVLYSTKKTQTNEAPVLRTMMGKLSDKLLFYMLFGMNQDLPNLMVEILKDQNSVSLLNKPTASGLPPLSAALFFEHYLSVKCFMESVLGSALDDADKLIVLLGNSCKHQPSLWAAYDQGKHQSVKVYVDTVLSSGLSEAHKMTLLEAKCMEGEYKGVAGIRLPLQRGHTQAVLAFIKPILASEAFSSEQKVQLVKGEYNKLYSSLAVVIRNGHHETVRAYIDAILWSPLSNHDKLALTLYDSSVREALVGSLGRGELKIWDAFFMPFIMPKLTSIKDEVQMSHTPRP